ncbi:MAG: NAD(+) synthase, partial [Halobacteria archaeon]|nr:NAD(+) synthase [Halobacteria archaeon]
EYYRANSDRGIVVGTGNRSEVLLGYYTKYGDGGVDILPIGELYKTEVRDVARYLNVSERIIEKPPTAGLWEGQTDEEELGASYETIDRVLQYLVDEGMSVEGVAEKTSVDVSKVEDLKRTYERSEHKRKMPPSPDLR